MTSELRYRVRGPLAVDVARNAEPGTVFTRTSYDGRSRAFLEVSDEGYLVHHEGFKTAYWEWRETEDVRRSFKSEDGEAACQYFNSLVLSPGYRGPVRLDLEDEDAAR